jgi:hypothetical protein
VDASCNGKLVKVATEAIAFEQDLGSSLQAVTFAGAETRGVIFSLRDAVVCRDDGIWIVSYSARRPEVRIRHYTTDGRLLRFVDTAIPAPRLGTTEYDGIDADSVREEDGRLRFERLFATVSGGKTIEKKRELFEVVL